MCGIAGYVDFKQTPDLKILRSMLSKIRYRGPDSQGLYADRSVALGVRRLRIIDLITGEQPIYNEDGSLVIIFNGEIYNYLELKENLLRKGHKFRTKSDTEVILHLYEEFGTVAPRYLNGMFAFAIWNRKTKTLFLARDQSGIKPLYYYNDKNTLIFGSEIKTILAHPRLNREIDRRMVDLYITLGYVPGSATIFRNIFKLEPGSSLTFSAKNVSTQHYWTVPGDYPEEKNDLDWLLEDSIRRQLVADVPVGIFLSGGLDSSLLTYYASRVKKNIKSFSVSFTDPHFDESNYAKKISKLFGTKHYQTLFEPKDIIRLFPQVMDQLDEPIGDPTIFPTYAVCHLAREQVTVALSGEGGDELFGGYDTYQPSLAGKISDHLPIALKGRLPLLEKFIRIHSAYYQRSPGYHRVLQGLSMSPFTRHLYWSSGVDYQKLEKTLLIVEHETWFKKILQEIQKENWSESQQKQFFDLKTHLRDYLLVKADRVSMFNSLELRVPYLDPRIIRFAFSQGKNHVSPTMTKILLKNLAKGKLPPEIINRQKRGFTIPISAWVRDELSSLVQDNLSNQKLYDFLDKDSLQESLRKHNNRIENHAKFIWRAVVFSSWLENWSS